MRTLKGTSISAGVAKGIVCVYNANNEANNGWTESKKLREKQSGRK